MALTLTTDERTELERRVRSLKIRAEDARRARVILMLANGDSYSTIEATIPCYRDYINRWRRRFLADRLDGLAAAVSRAAADDPDADHGSAHLGEDAAAAAGRQHALEYPQTGAPAQDSSQPRGESLAARGPPAAPVRAVHAVGRSRLRTEGRRRDGLYINPPDHAAVFAVDEKTAIQALDRLDPVLPLSPGRAERHGFEYYRHGTLSLFAALNTQSGEVLGQTVPRHTSAAFVEFLGDIVASQPRRREIHVIADNLSTHKTQAVRTFLLAHPHVRLHFTPTYSSWLNQVELWFSKIERDLLARGIFTSVADLARKIRRYIHRYNQAPKPIRWAYRNPARRIGSTSASTVH